jgi:hypothetical protein
MILGKWATNAQMQGCLVLFVSMNGGGSGSKESVMYRENMRWLIAK